MDLSKVDLNTGYNFKKENKSWLNKNAMAMPKVFQTASIPDEVDPRPWHRIENQGNMGSCRGHSLSSGFERLFWIANRGEITQFSRMWCYLETQRIDGLFGRDQGSTIYGGIKLGTTLGIAPETSFPYPSRYTTNYPKSRDELLKEAKEFIAFNFIEIESYEQAKQLLGTGWYIDMGTMWPIQMDSSYTVTSFRNYGSGGHATAALGYLKDGRLVVANSHSSEFGDHGWYYYNERGFNEMLSQRYSSVYAVSEMKNPKPRRPDHASIFG